MNKNPLMGGPLTSIELLEARVPKPFTLPSGERCDLTFDLTATAASLSEFMGVIAGIAVPTLLLVLQSRQTSKDRRPRGGRVVVLLPVLVVASLAAAYQYAVVAGEQSCARLGLLSVLAAPTLVFVVVLVVVLMASLADEFEVDDKTMPVVLKVIFVGTLIATTIALTVNFVDAQQTAGNGSIGMRDVLWFVLVPLIFCLVGAYIRDAYRNSSEIKESWRRDHPFFRVFMLLAGAIVLATQALFGLAAGAGTEAADSVADFFARHDEFAAWLHSIVVGLLMMFLTMAYPRLPNEKTIFRRVTGVGEAALEWIIDDD